MESQGDDDPLNDKPKTATSKQQKIKERNLVTNKILKKAYQQSITKERHERYLRLSFLLYLSYVRNIK